MANTDTVLLGVANDYSVKIGLPPKNKLDSFNSRAAIFGKVKHVSHVACSPEGELFCIRGGDLYRGPLPSNRSVNWFSSARKVGKHEWNRVKCMFFHPKGDLYVILYSGELYFGPQPDNEHLTWLYPLGKKIGKRVWDQYDAVLFDTEGVMYAVSNRDKIYRGQPPNDEDFPWLTSSTCVGKGGWSRLTHFMSFTPDGKLWCVDKYNGNLYRGDPPTESEDYLTNAEYLGWAYHDFRFFAFSKDKTIHNILSFEFLPNQGEKVSEQPEILEEKVYDNRNSSSTMKQSFTVQRTIKECSSFTQEQGFTFEMGIEATCKTGIPYIAEGSMSIQMNMSTTHTWNFTKTNETEITFFSTTEVELVGGKAIRMVASVIKAKMNVPYIMKGRTMFGSEVEMRGTWRGVTYYNLMIKQEDYNE